MSSSLIFYASILYVESHTLFKPYGVRIYGKLERIQKKNKNNQRVEKLQKYLVWRKEV